MCLSLDRVYAVHSCQQRHSGGSRPWKPLGGNVDALRCQDSAGAMWKKARGLWKKSRLNKKVGIVHKSIVSLQWWNISYRSITHHEMWALKCGKDAAWFWPLDSFPRWKPLSFRLDAFWRDWLRHIAATKELMCCQFDVLEGGWLRVAISRGWVTRLGHWGSLWDGTQVETTPARDVGAAVFDSSTVLLTSESLHVIARVVFVAWNSSFWRRFNGATGRLVVNKSIWLEAKRTNDCDYARRSHSDVRKQRLLCDVV